MLPRRRRLDRLARARPGQAARLARPAARGPGGVARLEMAVHLPGPGRRQRQPAGRPGRRAAAFRAHLGERDERLLRAAARQHDLHDERHGDAAQPAGRPAGHLSTACRPSSAATASPTCISRCERRCRTTFAPGSTRARASGPDARSRASYAELAQQSSDVAPFTYRDVEPDLFRRSSAEAAARARPAKRAGARPRRVAPRVGGMSMLGKLTWAAIPVRPADPAGRRRVVVVVVIVGVLACDRAEGLAALSVARVDHQRRPQADRRHVRPARRW